MRVLFTRVVTGAVTGVVSVAVTAGFGLATSGTAEAAGCRTSFDHYSTVKAGKTGSKARAVECLLHRAGYATTQDASFSTTDAKKLAKFQRKHKLAVTSRTDGATWAALIAQGSTPALEHGDRGASVRRLQLSLRALGHDELPGTTLYGSQTRTAVKALQRSAGLPVTGKTSDAEWAVLQSGGQAPTTGSGGSGGSDPGDGSTTATKGETALAFAKKQLGDKYEYGAAGPSKWDCSGLTMKAWAAAGVTLPHSAKAQYKLGKKVKKADLQPGDLVFFYSAPSHVAIYAGDGVVVHSPRPGKTVSYIKLEYMPWKGARRPG